MVQTDNKTASRNRIALSNLSIKKTDVERGVIFEN